MRILIYREDLKVLKIRKDNSWEFPDTNFTNKEEIKQWIKENLGFHIQIYGDIKDDLIIARRIFGPVNAESKWVDIDDERIRRLVEEDIEFWQDRQLEIIKQVFESFKKSGINIYLYGGWGVDFLAGKVTRPHVDIDTLIDIKDKEKARKLIDSMGYLIKDKGNKFQNEAKPLSFGNEKGEFSEGFDVYFLDFNSKIPDAHGNIPTAELFRGAIEATLNNVTAKVINPKLFTEMLERKIKFNQNNPEGLSGPIDKTEHDLKLVKSYLVATVG